MEEKNAELKLYSISAAAKQLSVRKDNLLKLIEDGKIGVLNIGSRRKISHLELVQFIKSNTVKLNPASSHRRITIGSITQKHKSKRKKETINEIDKIFDKFKEN